MCPCWHPKLPCMFHFPFINNLLFVPLACSGGVPVTCSGMFQWLTSPRPPCLGLRLRFGQGGHPLACPPLGMRGWGRWRVPLGWAWGTSWGCEGVFSLGCAAVFLSRTGESANQTDELGVREEEEEEEEESVEDSEEGSEQDSPASLFLVFRGALRRGFRYLLGVCFVLAAWVCFGLGIGVYFGPKDRCCDEGGGRGGGGRPCELLALSGGRRHVVNAAPALHLRLHDATTAGYMVGQGRQHLYW